MIMPKHTSEQTDGLINFSEKNNSALPELESKSSATFKIAYL